MLFACISICILCLVHSGVTKYVEDKAKPEPKPICGYNEVAVPCRQICPPQDCEIAYTEYACTEESKICEPGCDCLPDHLRNDSGICIPNHQCPPPKPEPVCGYNEVAVPCRQICPPQNCEIAYTDYACTEESKICEAGCDCLPDHLRNGSGICIPNEKCPYPSTPVCGINEIARDCRRICPPQTCLSKYALFRCAAEIPCEPGCDCVPNYLRDERGICIPSEKCPAPCQVTEECRRTCGRPNPENCPYNPPKYNMDGCDCKEGYILSELGGKCIPIDQCPPETPCNGDPYARPKRCPKPCPSTCQSPDQFPCKRMCEAIGCQCKPGYLLSNSTDSAMCILPDKCPGGNPCGNGSHFVDCKIPCESDYCPMNDSRDPVYCDYPQEDCLSGCVCDLNHKRKSYEDPRCIESSKCRPVNCTRQYEEYDSCPSACKMEDCKDIYNQPTTCNTLVLNCEPRCVCIKDHFRNTSGICVRAEDCPPPGCGGDPHAVISDCPSACEPTCDNPDPQICTLQCMPPGCVCMQGYVLNEETGKCVKREECPVPVCEDEHAIFKECTSACEPTCDNPYPEYCTDECRPAGCVCKEGYVLNEETGKCVEPQNCPKPVCEDPHAVFNPCPSACEPTCDNPDPQICTEQCMPPGCVCKEGYVLNEETGKCVTREQCPEPVCEDPNAEFKNCTSDCDPTCDNQNPQNCTEQCKPAGCVCKQGYVLNEKDGKCVEPCNCPEPVCEDPNAEFKNCTSDCVPTCDNQNPQNCTEQCMPPGCVCKEGYVLNEKDGKCVEPCCCPD